MPNLHSEIILRKKFFLSQIIRSTFEWQELYAIVTRDKSTKFQNFAKSSITLILPYEKGGPDVSLLSSAKLSL